MNFSWWLFFFFVYFIKLFIKLLLEGFVEVNKPIIIIVTITIIVIEPVIRCFVDLVLNIRILGLRMLPVLRSVERCKLGRGSIVAVWIINLILSLNGLVRGEENVWTV